MPYYRILHILDDPFGLAGQSEQLNMALLDAGHGVTALRPAEMPWLFEGDTVVSGGLRSFLERSRPQLVLISDGLEIGNEDMEAASRAGAIVLRVGVDGAVAIADSAAANPLFHLEPSMAASYQRTELANFVQQAACVLCAQDATESRREYVRELREALEAHGSSLDVVAIGAGWQTEGPRREPSALAYASRFAVAAIVFPSEAEEAEPRALAAPLSDGVPMVLANGANLPSFAVEGAGIACESPQDAAQAAVHAAASVQQPTEWLPARRLDGRLASEPLDAQAERLLAFLREHGLLGGGYEQPAVHAVMCGYYGTGNFGDEAILSHVKGTIERHCGLAVVSAIAADAPSTWHRHGIESFEVREHGRIQPALERASAMVVTAGLLFDQGMRWTCGAGALASDAHATDLPGLFQLTALARSCGAEVLFYGTGDGPLELEASRRCMEAAGRLGAMFYPRNEESARMLLGCGIDKAQVRQAGDTLFDLDRPGPEAARAWAKRVGLDFDGSRIAVVALREWPCMPEGWEGALARGLDRLADAGCTVVFVDFAPEDADVHRAVRDRMTRQDACAMLGPADDEAAALSLLGMAWAGLAMRLHCALVLGAFGVPSVGIGYLPKVEALYAQLGLKELLMPLAFSPEDVDRATTALIDRHDELAACAADGAARQRDLANVSWRALEKALDQPRLAVERRFWPVSRSTSEMARDRADWLEWLAGERAVEIEALKRQLAEAEERAESLRHRAEEAEREAEELRTSRSHRMGHALMKPLAKARSIVRRED